MNAATFRCTCVYLKNPHLLGVSLGEQSNEIETSFLRFKSFTLAAKLKQKSFVARLQLKSNQQLAVLLFTLAKKWKKMKIITKWTAFFRFKLATVFPGLKKYALPWHLLPIPVRFPPLPLVTLRSASLPVNNQWSAVAGGVVFKTTSEWWVNNQGVT